MQVDKTTFPINTTGLHNAKVLIWPDEPKGDKRKNVIIENHYKNI